MSAKKSKSGKKPARGATKKAGRPTTKRATKKGATKKPAKKASPRLTAGSYVRALATASSSAASVKTRRAEVEKLVSGVCESPKVFSGLLALLLDTSEPAELRRAALRSLQAASFSVVAFTAQRTEYIAALRSLVADPDLEIRQSVLGILARERDGHVQQLLLDGLEDADSALLSPEKALQLLGYDIHVEVYPLARKIVKSPPNPEAKREALRLLGADAASIPLFESILRNKRESTEVRRIAASALQTLKPEALQKQAREIVLDDDEDDELKATGLTALAQFGSAEGVGRDAQLRAKTDELTRSGSSATKRGAKAFLTKYHGE